MTLSPSQPQAAPRYSWAEIWTAVLTRPSVQTFQEILGDPAVSRRRAYTWMLVTWIVNLIFIMILTTRDPNEFLAAMPAGMKISPAEMQSVMLTSTLCAMPFALAIGLLVFYLMVRLAQFVAGQLGGNEKTKNAEAKSDVGTLVTYSFAAVQAPLNIVSLLFAALPANAITGIISLIATCYQFYLMSLALRAIYGFSSGRAMAAVFVTFVVFLTGAFVLTYALMSALAAM